MNKLTIIGNLTREPELRTTANGINICDFTVAVNRKKKVEGQPDADFFRVSAWRGLADLCAKYLAKGKKVCVIGTVSVRTYTSERDGVTRANMEVTADEVEFLSPKEQEGQPSVQANTEPEGYTAVDTDELPF